MKISALIGLLSFGFYSHLTLADSCLGRGTVFFYGNGMFNTLQDAVVSRDSLAAEIRKRVQTSNSKNILFETAMKAREPLLSQLMNVAIQKKIEDFETFWLWVDSLKESPPWFQELVKQKLTETIGERFTEFSDLRDHFESYSHYIRNGYNVIVVSHSQGNFYANQAMKKLANYTDASLTGSISEKQKKNLLFPKFFEFFANTQVATPVAATINGSPWSNFHDDLVMDLVRKTAGALPPNLKTNGIGIPPDGDLLGHNFVKAYLRNEESRTKILTDVRNQYDKLRYPIAYFNHAVLIKSRWRHFDKGDHLTSPDADLDFTILGPSNHNIHGKDEKRPNKNEILWETFADCHELPLGTSKIEMGVYAEKDQRVSFQVWPEGDQEKEPTLIELSVKRGTSDWEVGSIETRKGVDKDPLEVSVQIYPQPRLLSKSK